MKLLFTIPHYYEPQPVNTGHGSLREDPQIRLQSLTSCITTLHQLFGRPQCIIDHVERTTTPANQLTAERLDVVVCTTGNHHLLQYLALEPNYYHALSDSLRSLAAGVRVPRDPSAAAARV